MTETVALSVAESVTVTVADVVGAPMTKSDAGEDPEVDQHDLLALTVPFADEDRDDDRTATTEWGDGITAGEVDEAARTVSGEHRYLVAGFHHLEVCIDDSRGGTACDSVAVEVHPVDPVIFVDGFEDGTTGEWS